MGTYYPDGTAYEEMKDIGRQNIGRRLKNLRIGYGDKQKDVAELCDVTKSYISKVERGKSDIKATMIPLLADRYNTYAESFFNDQGEINEGLIRRILRMNHLEEMSKTVATRMNLMADMAFDRGNEATLLRMLYAVLKACGETDHPTDTYFSTLQEIEPIDITEIPW